MDADGFVLCGSAARILHYDTNGHLAGEFDLDSRSFQHGT